MRPVNRERLYSAVNKYIDVGSYLIPRVDVELPRLLEMARSLIVEIRAEYPE